MQTGRAQQGGAATPPPVSPQAASRIVIPSPANENRAPLALRILRIAALVATVAVAVWLLRVVF
jgi:hypothetical protein